MKSLDQLEREFIYIKLQSGNSKEPLNNLRRRYYASLGLADAAQTSLSELEDRWLVYYITDNSLIPVDDTAGKWMQMVAIAGGTPTKFINENKRLFYALSIGA